MTHILLDLGNVVTGIDFRRVFTHWSNSSGVPEQRFYDRWQLDEAYEQHEIGAISFEEYAAHLGRVFEADMRIDQWRDGWNDLWTGPFESVVGMLPALASQRPLYAFTNTNNTHVDCWSELYAKELEPFEKIFISSEIGVRKPAPSAYLHVCELMNADPATVLFIDDTLVNVEGALEAGLDAHHAKSEEEVAAILNPLLDR